MSPAHPNRGGGNPSANPSPEEIRAFRLAAGLTLQQAGELIHSGKRSWEDWESGRRRMHPAFWELAQIRASGHLPCNSQKATVARDNLTPNLTRAD